MQGLGRRSVGPAQERWHSCTDAQPKETYHVSKETYYMPKGAYWVPACAQAACGSSLDALQQLHAGVRRGV